MSNKILFFVFFLKKGTLMLVLDIKHLIKSENVFQNEARVNDFQGTDQNKKCVHLEKLYSTMIKL